MGKNTVFQNSMSLCNRETLMQKLYLSNNVFILNERYIILTKTCPFYRLKLEFVNVSVTRVSFLKYTHLYILSNFYTEKHSFSKFNVAVYSRSTYAIIASKQ